MNTQQQAQQIIDDNAIVIDTETTGLQKNDLVVEIAAVRARTGEQMSTVIRPYIFDVSTEIDWNEKYADAQAVHGITWHEIDQRGILLPDALRQIWMLSTSHPRSAYATAFNTNFDKRLIEQSVHTYDNATVRAAKIFGSVCIMELANRHLVAKHGVWKSESAQFGRLSLAKCCEIMGIKFEDQAHRALADAVATTKLIHAIANDK